MSEKQWWLITLDGSFRRALWVTRDEAEAYLIREAVGCGYVPLWRTDYAISEDTPVDCIDYGIESRGGAFRNSATLRPLNPILSTGDERYTEEREGQEDELAVWEHLRSKGNGKRYVEPDGTRYSNETEEGEAE